MVADVFPFRAIVLQSLLLAAGIAIESAVLLRLMKLSDQVPTTPKQSIQYAASMNLLSAVLGWFAIFSLFNLETLLPPDWTQAAQTAILNLIFFSQTSAESLSFLLIIIFITFFASFAVKLVGLWGLKWLLLQSDSQTAPDIAALPERDSLASMGMRDLRKNPRNESHLNISTVLIANAWSCAATSGILLILFLQPF